MKRSYSLWVLGAVLLFGALAVSQSGEFDGYETLTVFGEHVEADAKDKPVWDETKELIFYDTSLGRLVINATVDLEQITATDCYEDLRYEFVLPLELDGPAGGFTVPDEYIQTFEYRADGEMLRITAHERTVAEFEITADDSQVYLKARHPKEVYDKIVVIDPGHGGEDSGAWSEPDIVEHDGKPRIVEKDYNLAVGLQVMELFSKDDSGIKTYLTRTTDRTRELSYRADMRDYLADLFVSIHLNTSEYPSAHGLTTYFYGMLEPREYTGKMLSVDIADAAAAESGMHRREIDYGDYFVLRESVVPATLLEIGFLTNEGDLRRMASEDFSERVSKGIYNGILTAFDKYERQATVRQ